MSLTHETGYSQQRYSRGVCFRLSFKWAALSLVGGTFNLATDTAGLNVAKTTQKHVDYRKVSATTEANPSYDFTDKKLFDAYVEEDGRQAIAYINRWGVHFRGAKTSSGGQGTLYNGVSLAQLLDEPLTAYFASNRGAAAESLVYGYYGHKGKDPAGHAVAFSKGKFFDSNSGIWDCNPPSSAGVDIDDYVVNNYSSQFKLEKFAIFVLDHQPNTGRVTNQGCCTLF